MFGGFGGAWRGDSDEFFIFTHKKQWCYPSSARRSEGGERKKRIANLGFGERSTLCQHNSAHTPKRGFRVEHKDEAKKRGNFRLFSNTQWRTLESFFLLVLPSSSPLFSRTTHAQILLSLRYNIIPFYLNLATINLRKMVKRKIPLITSSAQHNTLRYTLWTSLSVRRNTTTRDNKAKSLSGSRAAALRVWQASFSRK